MKHILLLLLALALARVSQAGITTAGGVLISTPINGLDGSAITNVTAYGGTNGVYGGVGLTNGVLTGNGSGLTNISPTNIVGLTTLYYSTTNIYGATNTSGVGAARTNCALSFTLTPGTWAVEIIVWGATASASGGVSGNLQKIGTDVWLGMVDRGYIYAAANWTGSQIDNNFIPLYSAGGYPVSWSRGFFTVITTQTNTYNPILYQQAVDPVSPPYITTNSYVKVTRIK